MDYNPDPNEYGEHAPYRRDDFFPLDGEAIIQSILGWGRADNRGRPEVGLQDDGQQGVRDCAALDCANRPDEWCPECGHVHEHGYDEGCLACEYEHNGGQPYDDHVHDNYNIDGSERRVRHAWYECPDFATCDDHDDYHPDPDHAAE